MQKKIESLSFQSKFLDIVQLDSKVWSHIMFSLSADQMSFLALMLTHTSQSMWMEKSFLSSLHPALLKALHSRPYSTLHPSISSVILGAMILS